MNNLNFPGRFHPLVIYFLVTMMLMGCGANPTPALPASTFTIMNSMVGLETGVIADKNHVIKWDGRQYEIPAWNQDHTLHTAMNNSVWYHQELARQVGREQAKMPRVQKRTRLY